MEPEKVVSEEEKYSYVVAGAYLKCTGCDTYSILTAPLSHGVYINKKAQMNIMDFKPILNIRPFGVCKFTGNACVPATIPWNLGKKDKLVENQPALLNKSKTRCTCGGEITIVDDGQG